MIGQGGFDANTIETAHTTIREIFADAAAMLDASASRWLFGDSISIADLVMLPVVVRVVTLGGCDLVDVVPVLARRYATRREWASYQQVFGQLRSYPYPEGQYSDASRHGQPCQNERASGREKVD